MWYRTPAASTCASWPYCWRPSEELPAGSCRQSNPAADSASQAAAQPQPIAPPQFNAEDFDPTPQTPPALKVSGEKAFHNLKDFVALGPRYLGSPGHAKAEHFILTHLEGAAEIEQDQFTAQTPRGPVAMKNIIVKFPGKSRQGDRDYRPLRHQTFRES